VKTFKLKNENEIPALGLGTWKLVGKLCEEIVEKALEVGYRHIDTAEIYGNQQDIGNVISKNLVKRKELFITSKVWSSELSKDETIDSCKKTLEALQTDYLDLLLIHWPSKAVPVTQTLGAMELLRQEKLIKNYGVSNFTIKELEETKGFEVVINQVEFHPSLNQQKLKEYCDKEKIVVTAYSPLGQGYDLKLPEVKRISGKHKVSTAQVVLNWLLQKGIVAIPKSGDKKHLRDNFKALDWKLNEDDMEVLDSLHEGRRLVNPGFFDD
jgi:diketogulonate reductase-like aldo/keto reductase